jgi:ribonuclease D
MKAEIARHTLIEDDATLKEFAQRHEQAEWLCFDTEFIGEKRFVTTICLIQVTSTQGVFLIDPLKCTDLQPFLALLTNERILKVTHAGANDYRLFYTHFGIVPRNTFDTQIAAGFLGYKYPVAFNKLVESELDVRLSKGYSVTDWEKRPFQKKQLSYALDDVIYLYDLWQNLERKLRELGRYEWVVEEFRQLEDPQSYEQDPYKEALQSNLIKSLRPKDQVFLVRLFLWRTEEARRKDHSKEMVIPSKFINAIVRAIHSGLDALQHNRRLPGNLIGRYGQTFIEMYERPMSDEEKEFLEQLPRDNSDNPKQDILMEMLDLLVRYKCLEEGVSPSLVLPRGALKKMKNDKDYFEESIENGWRKAFLGEEIANWFKNRRQLKIEFTNGKFELKM